jgi:hypothetical protein
MNTLYELVSVEEFIQMGKDLSDENKKIRQISQKALKEYQIWQNGPLNEETQKPFEKAIEEWRRLER